MVIGLLLAFALAGCTFREGLRIDGDSVDCGPQHGMTGDLSADLPGIWRFSWTGSADGGPADSLLVFESDGTAVMVSERFGHTRWSWSVHGDEVRMFGHVAHEQGFFPTWSFGDGIWTINATDYGETTLERCTAPSS